MKIKGVIEEDFVNYKKPCMTIQMPICNGFKCGSQFCQNSELALYPVKDIDIDFLIYMYLSNPISEAIVFQGLEPFDSFNDLINFIDLLRKLNDDEIVIYTGYNKDEISDYLQKLKKYDNIIIKYGRYIPNQEKHFDEVLGVYLVSDNQYAERLKES